MTPRPWTSAAALMRCRQASTLDLARMVTAATARGWMRVLPRGEEARRTGAVGALAALVALAAGSLSAATFCLCPPGRTPLPSLCGMGARAVRAVRAMTTG